MITSKKIIELLSVKHANDLCITECKTGPTWNASNCPRLDFVAIKCSWSKPNIFGYEVKISRQDFINDNKWPQYLEYCTDFYFVAPPGIIEKNELSKETGLLTPTKNCTRLYTIKKAPFRKINNINSLNELFKYILICRSKIIKRQEAQTKKEYWEIWLKNRDDEKQLGYNVSKKIRQIVQERITDVNSENEELKSQIDKYQFIYDFLLKNGFSDHMIKTEFKYNTINKLEKIITEEKTGIPGGFKEALNFSIKNMKIMEDIINKQKE